MSDNSLLVAISWTFPFLLIVVIIFVIIVFISLAPYHSNFITSVTLLECHIVVGGIVTWTFHSFRILDMNLSLGFCLCGIAHILYVLWFSPTFHKHAGDGLAKVLKPHV